MHVKNKKKNPLILHSVNINIDLPSFNETNDFVQLLKPDSEQCLLSALNSWEK